MTNSNRVHGPNEVDAAEHERLWERVNAAFDERRDPFDDADVQRLVAERPEWLDEVQRARRAIAAVSHAPRAPATRALSTGRDLAVVDSRAVSGTTALVTARSASRIGWHLAASVVFVFATVAFMIRSAHDDSTERASSGRSAPVGCVHSFHAEVIDEDVHGRSTTRFDGVRAVRTRETFLAPAILGDSRTPGFVAVVQSSSVPFPPHPPMFSPDDPSLRSVTR